MNVLITGGAGFVGCNLANALLSEGRVITILDNLSRKGSEGNLNWLLQAHADKVQFIKGDVRDTDLLFRAVKGQNMIFHLAAQVAVTSSVREPLDDFEINAKGTLNVLEAARSSPSNPVVLFTSTNKVYGSLQTDVKHLNTEKELMNPKL